MKFVKLSKVYVTSSTRKFDKFGDWMYIKMTVRNLGAVKGLLSSKNKGNKKG